MALAQLSGDLLGSGSTLLPGLGQPPTLMSTSAGSTTAGLLGPERLKLVQLASAASHHPAELMLLVDEHTSADDRLATAASAGCG